MRGCVFLIICVLGGCTLDRQYTPEQIFRRAVAGMAGKERVTFTGQTGIRANGGLPPTKQFKYTGEVTNHDELIMQWEAAENFRKQGDHVALTKDKTKSGVAHERFLRQKGKWIALASGDTSMAQNGMLNRFNPIQELEELNTLNKNVRMEQGAARGTWVVRIEPEPASAKRWLKEHLMEEMNALNPQTGILNAQYTATNQKLQQKLSQVWKQSCEDMNNQLEHSTVRTVYHLTIDRQTGLPLKLSSECRISRQVTNEEQHQEALITRVAFEDYK
ncbi:hypothetical protein ABEW32_15605 [Paenibacillus jamilae]|uniref:hypothetical protein n=1 Tax=Paenibacillus jamilae TaxID=114136 RepID=UPI003D298A44